MGTINLHADRFYKMELRENSECVIDLKEVIEIRFETIPNEKIRVEKHNNMGFLAYEIPSSKSVYEEYTCFYKAWINYKTIHCN